MPNSLPRGPCFSEFVSFPRHAPGSNSRLNAAPPSQPEVIDAQSVHGRRTSTPEAATRSRSNAKIPVYTLGFAGKHTHHDRYAGFLGAYKSGSREGKRVDTVMEMDATGDNDQVALAPYSHRWHLFFGHDRRCALEESVKILAGGNLGGQWRLGGSVP